MKDIHKFPNAPEPESRLARLSNLKTSTMALWRRNDVLESAIEDFEDAVGIAAETSDDLELQRLLEETADFLRRLRAHEYDTLFAQKEAFQ